MNHVDDPVPQYPITPEMRQRLLDWYHKTRETEWKVVCANGHATYERVRGIPPVEVRFTDCPKCGAPRKGEQLLPPRERR